MQTPYRSRPVRSPYQPHPSRTVGQRATDTRDSGNPFRQMLEKSCQTRYELHATFSPDANVMSALKTPGLIAVKCELTMPGKGVVGIGHGSSVISQINRGVERSIFGCMNGALMSAINAACKTLDVVRLEEMNERAAPSTVAKRSAAVPEIQMEPEERGTEPITDRQKSYLLELIQGRVADRDEREQLMSQIDGLTKEEASAAIRNFTK